MKILLDVNKNLQNAVIKMKNVSSKNENSLQMFLLVIVTHSRDIV